MDTEYFSESMRGKDFGDINADGRIILKNILEKQGVKMWTICI
jgi:hypothetical protein